jgi:hypothetical protein
MSGTAAVTTRAAGPPRGGPDACYTCAMSRPLGDEPRYTDQELAVILKRAAELQDGAGDARYSLAEVKQIAAEAGIAPEQVEAAAVALRRERLREPAARSGYLGAPTRIRFERTIDGEVPSTAIPELIDIARRALALQGETREVLNTVEWCGRGGLGVTFLTITRERGRTRIALLSARDEGAALVSMTTGLGGVIAALGIGTALVGASVVAGPLAAVPLALAGGGVASWLAARTIWRTTAPRWFASAEALGEEIADAAVRVIAREQGSGDRRSAPTDVSEV